MVLDIMMPNKDGWSRAGGDDAAPARAASPRGRSSRRSRACAIARRPPSSAPTPSCRSPSTWTISSGCCTTSRPRLASRHASTRTGTRCTALFANPHRFQSGSSGCAAAAPVARPAAELGRPRPRRLPPEPPRRPTRTGTRPAATSALVPGLARRPRSPRRRSIGAAARPRPSAQHHRIRARSPARRSSSGNARAVACSARGAIRLIGTPRSSSRLHEPVGPVLRPIEQLRHAP